MPTRKIDEPVSNDTWANTEKDQCRDPDHSPPSHQYLTPGLYEHECPTCGRKIRFRIRKVSLNVKGWKPVT